MSREAELYKDKIEVSLDGRQIFYLFFGGAVIVGLVFVLGVMVGRRVEARGHSDRARVAATVDPLAALDRLEGGSGLSFQGALRGADGPVSDVEKTIAAQKGLDKGLGPQASGLGGASGVGSKKEEAKKDDVKVEPKKDEAKVEAKKADAKVEAKKDEPKVEAKAEAKKDEAKKDDKVEAKKTELKKDDKADAKKTETKKDDKSEAKKTEAKADKSEAASDKKKDEAKSDAKKESHYTLQLSSFQDKAEAQAYLESVKKAGYSAYVAEGTVDGKQYFRVRLGSYKSMDAANEAKADVEKATKKSALVMKL